MVETNAKIFLDVSDYLYNASAYLYLYISIRKLPRAVAKYDWTEKRKVSSFDVQGIVMWEMG